MESTIHLPTNPIDSKTKVIYVSSTTPGSRPQRATSGRSIRDSPALGEREDPGVIGHVAEKAATPVAAADLGGLGEQVSARPCDRVVGLVPLAVGLERLGMDESHRCFATLDGGAQRLE